MKPYPKKTRIVDKELIESIRAGGRCILSGMGECCGELDVHHIDSRGSGGDDVYDNLVLLCRCHHTRAHYAEFSKEILIARKRWDEYIRKPLTYR